MSIPKLELKGAVLEVQPSKEQEAVLRIPLAEHGFWTDSLSVLYLLKSQSRQFSTDTGVIAEIQFPHHFWNGSMYLKRSTRLAYPRNCGKDCTGKKHWRACKSALHSSESLISGPCLPTLLFRPLLLVAITITSLARKELTLTVFHHRFST